MGDIRKTLGEREYDKFVESPTRPERTAVETFDINSINGPMSGVIWNTFQYSYPTPDQEVITFYLSAVLKATVTLNYTNSTKNFLLSGSVVKT
jgi:hypothetical protein